MPTIERLSGPAITRASRAAAEVLDADQRLVRLSFSSEEPYTRSSWFDEPWVEILGHDDAEVDLGRLNNAAPLLWGHNAYERDAHVGVIERAWIENGKGYADVRFSKRADVDGLYQDVVDGIARNISVGYKIHERTLVKTNATGPNEYRVTRWEPMEISVVPIPADPTVGVGRAAETGERYTITARSITPIGERAMADENRDTPAAQPPGNPNPNADAVRAEARAAERKRLADIRAAARALNVPDADVDAAIDGNQTVEQIREAWINAAAQRDAARPISGAHVSGGEDLGRAAQVEGITTAILARMDTRTKHDERSQPYRYLSMTDIARASLEMCGVRGVKLLSPVDVADKFLAAHAGRAHTTSDFPLLLSNVAGKRLRAIYDQAQPTYMQWSRRAPNARDFKPIEACQISAAPSFLQISQGDSIKYGTLSEGREFYSVISYGRGLQVTREAIVNDDLRGFDTAIRTFGNSARRLENELVYGQIDSGTAGPNLADGGALFQAAPSTARGNNLVTPGGAIDITSLGVGRQRMRQQTGLQGERLNIVPRFLICGPECEQLAYQFTSANYVPAVASNINEFAAGGRTALTPVIDAVITDNDWYLAADPDQVDTVEYAYLDGAEGVTISNMVDFDTQGIKVAARLDFGCKVVDFRGLFKNAGG